MHLSESSRVTTTEEARFRIQYPNSVPRSIKVIALDRESGLVVDALSRKTWNRAEFFTSLTFPARPAGTVTAKDQMQAWLSDVAGKANDLVTEIDTADTVVVVATAGSNAHAASMIGDAARMRHKTMISLVLRTNETTEAMLAHTLNGIRPFATMVVVANGRDYVEDMLTALRA